MKKLLLAVLVALSACTAQKVKKSMKHSTVFEQGFTGFMLLDPQKDKVVYALNEDKYFTPASNTKLFTFYAAYKVLGEQVNAVNYLENEDSLIFWGTGDPSLLHPDFSDNSLMELLKDSDKQLYLADNFDQLSAYASGWSWNWYNYYYGPDRSALPIYGNIVRFQKEKNASGMTFSPTYFKDNIHIDPSLTTSGYRILRDQKKNDFRINMASKGLEFATDKPFMTSSALAMNMLQDTLDQELRLISMDHVKGRSHQKLKGIAADSLYKQMLKISDNFLAEQLMVLVADELFDSLNVDEAIDQVKQKYLGDLPDEAQWVDGSGLSSQNKFTPRSIIKLLDKIRKEVPEEKIFAYFPSGGQSGTIKNWYPSDDENPYIYAKTGTLSGVHCLSGYLLTQRGKVLYFSFMHNNYVISSDELKKEMQKILYMVHTNYK